jgi:hypothetical protein
MIWWLAITAMLKVSSLWYRWIYIGNENISLLTSKLDLSAKLN